MFWSGEIGEESVALVAAYRFLSQFEAALAVRVAAFDARQAWAGDAARSMADWLKAHCGLSGRKAHQTVEVAAKLTALPGTSAAWADGELSTDQVKAISANVNDAEKFGAVEVEMVAELSGAPVKEVAQTMQRWAVSVDEVAEPRRACWLTKFDDGTGRLVPICRSTTWRSSRRPWQ